MFDSAGLRSSSREKLGGESPPPAVNAKSCGSFGIASFVIEICPRLLFWKVQVTVSPGATAMFDTGLPSSQVAAVWSQPLGTVSATEYPLPGSTSLKVRVFDSVPSESSSSWKLDGREPAAGGEGEVLRIVRAARP